MSRIIRPIGVVAAAAAVIALSGCGGSTQGATMLDAEADVTITWWTGQDEGAHKILEGLAEEFEKEHPNVTIEASPGASSTEELLQKMLAAFAGNRYPDISYAFGSWASELEGSPRVLDITDRVGDPSVGWDEFSESARQTVQPTGEKTIGFPAIVDNLSLIYNTTVFDEAGVDYPTDEWTWDDFRSAAKKLTDLDTQTYGYGYSVQGTEETTWQFWPHLWQEGGQILDDDGLAAFNSDAGVRALTRLQQMAVGDKSVYLDQTDTKAGQLFAADRIGMITSGPWQLYDLKTAGTEYGVVQLPGVDGDHQTVSGPDIWALFDHDDANREHWAFEFTKWLTSAEQDERWNVEIGNLPLRSSELESEAFLAQVKNYPGLEVMAANSANAKNARPTIKGYVWVSESIGHAISEVLQGAAEPKAALDAAAAESNGQLE